MLCTSNIISPEFRIFCEFAQKSFKRAALAHPRTMRPLFDGARISDSGVAWGADLTRLWRRCNGCRSWNFGQKP